MLLAKTLSWYKRKDVQQALLAQAHDREISIRFTESFGKRPNILQNASDVLEFAKRRATSFHSSEELWTNAMMLRAGMAKKEMDELRKGWDLILDVDCTYWPLAKIATKLFIEALQEHGITSVTCKFSGNKGFHIAVPFEAFPESIHNLHIKDWFPEGPQRIASYLIDYVAKKHIEVFDSHIKVGSYKISYEKLEQHMNLTKKELFGEEAPKAKAEFLCSSCGNTMPADDKEFINCPQCNGIMKKQLLESKPLTHKFDPNKLINLDTLLISARHAFRMAYSLHEKSELVSCPVDIEKILDFKREDAAPENIDFSIPFLERTRAKNGEASKLVLDAFDHAPNIEYHIKEQKEFEVPEQAIPEENFPPCIKNILAGLQDGKKRSLFILRNFLTSVGWSHELIEERVKIWNQNNPEPLRETVVVGNLRYAKQQKTTTPPPNCRNYYQELGVCKPDTLCDKIKNPVTYAKRRWQNSMNAPKKRAKKQSQKKEG